MSLTGFLLAVGGSRATSATAADAAREFFRGFGRSSPTQTPLGEDWLVCCDLRAGSVAVQSNSCRQQGGLTLCFDGWLENAPEIAAECRCRPDSADIEIVLAACRTWGDAAANRLVGEYSFVLWDASARRLLAVRDKVGVRPLFYAGTDGGIVVGNLPGAVATHPATDGSVNPGYAAEFLCVEESSVTETLFAGVRRLPGGHQLVWQRGQPAVTSRYWQPRADVRAIDRTGAQMEFATRLRHAVAGAARDAPFVGCDLSGGIDSSSVALQLGQLVRAGDRSAEATAALSLVYPGLPCDETPFIDAVAARLPFASYRLAPCYASLPDCATATAMLRYPYFPFNASGAAPILDHVRERGGVLLSGEGGDELFEPTEHALSGALFASREWPALRNYLARYWAARGDSRSLPGLARYALQPFAGRRLQNFIARWRDRRRAPEGWPIDGAWAQEVDIGRRVDRLLYPRNSRTLAMGEAQNGAWSASFEWIFFMACASGVECRHPLSSAALIEFCNRLPLGLLDGQEARNRVLLRQVFADDMPPLVANRTTKAEFTPATLPALRKRATDQLLPLTNEAEAAGSEHPARRFGADIAGAKHIWRLDAAVSFELWLRCLPPHAASGFRVRIF